MSSHGILSRQLKMLLHFQLLVCRMRPDVNQLWNASAFGYGNAHGLAKIYGILANGGSSNGKKLLSPETIELLSKKVKSGKDKVLGLRSSYGRGVFIMRSPQVYIQTDNFKVLRMPLI